MKRYLLLLLLPILAFASIGKITVLKGDVKLVRSGQTTTAKSGTTLEKNDFIKTAKNAKVQIIFTDKTIFTIGKNSTLDIADYLYDEAKPSKNKAKFNVLKGAFTSITGRIGKLNKSKFKLKTKSASIGIRGTIVKANQETIMCTEGAITVTTPNGATINIEAGSKTSVASGTPTAAQTIQAGDEADMGADVTKEDKEESQQQAVKEEKKEVKAQAKKQESTTQAAPVVQATTDTATDDMTETIQSNQDGMSKQTGYSVRNGVKKDNTQVTVNTNSNTATDGTDTLNVKSGDSTSSWGYWGDGAGGVDHKQVWVSGVKTDVGVLNGLKESGTQTTHTYSGQSIGNVQRASGTNEAIKVDSDNAVNLNFDLGGGKNNMDGNIKFKTENTSWNANFTGGTSGTGFKSTSISDNGAGNDNQIQSTGSNLEGSLYGKDAQSVGGAFKLNSAEQDTASGVFKATK